MKLTASDIKPWEWNPDLCPCDQEFLKWFEDNRFLSKRILHMGSGNHHRVGLTLHQHNCVVSTTLSPGEMARYIELVLADPYLSAGYTCVYGDIQLLDFNAFYPFDIITLFHFGEIATEPNSIRLLSSSKYRLQPDGYLLGYRHSAGAAVAVPLLELWFNKVGEYKLLDIYKQK